jgi:hypothetical protein
MISWRDPFRGGAEKADQQVLALRYPPIDNVKAAVVIGPTYFATALVETSGQLEPDVVSKDDEDDEDRRNTRGRLKQRLSKHPGPANWMT